MAAANEVTAWKPCVPGITEVLHAHLIEHAYPPHTHDCWTLLIVDQGVLRYDLGRREHGAGGSVVTLLPPDVVHDGRSVRPEGFRKRVLYLDRQFLTDSLIPAAVDCPAVPDLALRSRLQQLHDVLAQRTERFEAQSRLVLIRERLLQHLAGRVTGPVRNRDAATARRFRELLDARVPHDLTLAEAASLLSVHPAHLVRVFVAEYGFPPHRYLTGRRIDLARKYLLAGYPCVEVATLTGFYDQAHLSRHFKRLTGVSPGRYARSGGATASDRSGNR